MKNNRLSVFYLEVSDLSQQVVDRLRQNMFNAYDFLGNPVRTVTLLGVDSIADNKSILTFGATQCGIQFDHGIATDFNSLLDNRKWRFEFDLTGEN